MTIFRTAERRSFSHWSDADGSPRTPNRVTEHRATSLTPVLASIRHIVDFCSTLPADFFASPAGPKISDPELIRNVEDSIGMETWIGQMAYGMATRGNAVGKATMQGGYGRPTLVEWRCDWSGGDDGSPIYVGGTSIPDSLLIHVPWLVPPGKRMGLSPIERLAAIISAGLSAQEYADVKRGGGIPPSILKNNKLIEIDAAPARVIQRAAMRAFASGEPWVSGKDWDLSFPEIPPNHARFMELLRLTKSDIAAVYGIDPREIGGDAAQGSITYANDESRVLNRAHDLRPYLVRIERAVSRLLPAGQCMKFNIDATVRVDLKTRADVDDIKLKNGSLNVNEARAHDELGPVPGGERYNIPAPASESPATRGATS